MRFWILLSIFFINLLPAQCHQYLEKEYQNVWCSANKGILEYTLSDGARVDCVTQTHAIEFDFASKWAESIGQSLYYGKSLCKQSGVVLIMENPEKDERYLKRLQAVAITHGITVWTMTTADIKQYVLINTSQNPARHIKN